jgi:hypothetical protein
MKISYYAILIALLFTACKHKTEESILSNTKKDTAIYVSFTVDDPAQYSKQFLDSLKASHYQGSMKLQKDYILVGKDTTRFPQDLDLDKEYLFTSDSGATKYTLKVTRLNLTDIKFDYSKTLNGSVVYQEDGVGTLTPLFFLGSENPNDSKTGEGYGAYQYVIHKPKCISSVEIGIGRDDNDLLRAELIGCKDNTVNGTLRAK